MKVKPPKRKVKIFIKYWKLENVVICNKELQTTLLLFKPINEEHTSYNESPTSVITEIERNVQKILGGAVTPISEVPYVTALLQDNDIFCAGSILSSLFVVSAAHCLKA